MGQKWILVKEVDGWLACASKAPFHFDYSMHCDWIWEKKEETCEVQHVRDVCCPSCRNM